MDQVLVKVAPLATMVPSGMVSLARPAIRQLVGSDTVCTVAVGRPAEVVAGVMVGTTAEVAVPARVGVTWAV